MEYIPRKATTNDIEQIYKLYKTVSKTTGGLARDYYEITTAYVENFTSKSLSNGLQLVIQADDGNNIIAEIHGYKLEPKVFSHILSELTIVVDPAHQGKGIGKLIFKTLLDRITTECRDVLRVELIARASNERAIQLYQQLGFIIEGRLEHRIKTVNGFEADIPMAWINKNYKG
jgi:ribosomal protein S18 acetylase RimI-like enzyme